MVRSPTGVRCPKCGGTRIRGIVHGYLVAPLEEGLVSGGCTSSSDSPEYVCDSCGEEWFDRESARNLGDRLDLLKSVGG